MKRLTIIFFWVFLTASFKLQAQVPDSVQTISNDSPSILLDSSFVLNSLDTTITNQEKLSSKGRKPKNERFLYKVFNKDYPNPKTAMLLSFALPGTGQIYNKRWWKPPLVYGGMGLSIYNIVKNTNNYKRFRDAYIQFLAGETTEFEGQRFNNAADLKNARDTFDKNRQLSFVAALVVYGIQGAEAFVDAHLRTFDVSDDLSLRIKLKPAIETNQLYGTAMGIGLSVQFERPTPTPNFFVVP